MRRSLRQLPLKAYVTGTSRTRLGSSLTNKEKQMGATVKITEELAVQGNLEAMALIRRQMADTLGGEPTNWKWELGFEAGYGRVMLVTATR